MSTTITTLLPAAITPKSSKAAAPVQLATSFAEFSQSQPASPPTPTTTPPEAHAIVPTMTTSGGRRGGWPTKEEMKEMRAGGRAYDNGIIHEDAFEGGNHNNGLPTDNNAPELCLRQWDGDWLPPPVDWQARNPYKRPDRFAADIATWVDRTNAHYLTIHNGTSKLVINVDAEPFKNNAENVPRSWIPESLEKMPLQSFWHRLRQSSLQPIDEEDMDFAPYWLRYITTNPVIKDSNDFQEPLPVPNAHLDPGNGDVEMYRKGKSQTQKDLIYQHNRKVRLLEKRKDGARRKHIKALRKEAQQPVIAPPPNPHKPVANIYLRPASHRDFLQMIQIYNHYAGTHYSYAMTPMTLEEMAAKKRDIDRAEMIMIVAIQKTKQNLPRGHPTYLESNQEKVVGFAFTDEHEGRNALFRYAADLECYVHPETLGKGIGKSLVDRMLWLSNPYYRARDAVEWRPMSEEHHLITPGGKRILDSVRVQVFYPAEKEGETRLVWIQRWLEQFNFKKWGVVEGGIKLHKRVNMACFIHNRDIPVNAAACVDNVSV
jgi:L-amino acid N-acyltransferase YncA